MKAKVAWKVVSIKTDNWNISDDKRLLLENIERIRKSLGYTCYINISDRKIIYKISNREYLEIFLLKNKIISIIIHPKLGRTALKREGLTDEEMLSILFNPRTHINRANTKRKLKVLKN